MSTPQASTNGHAVQHTTPPGTPPEPPGGYLWNAARRLREMLFLHYAEQTLEFKGHRDPGRGIGPGKITLEDATRFDAIKYLQRAQPGPPEEITLCKSRALELLEQYQAEKERGVHHLKNHPVRQALDLVWAAIEVQKEREYDRPDQEARWVGAFQADIATRNTREDMHRHDPAYMGVALIFTALRWIEEGLYWSEQPEPEPEVQARVQKRLRGRLDEAYRLLLLAQVEAPPEVQGLRNAQAVLEEAQVVSWAMSKEDLSERTPELDKKMEAFETKLRQAASHCWEGYRTWWGVHWAREGQQAVEPAGE